MYGHRPVPFIDFGSTSLVPFESDSLGSEALKGLYDEMASSIEGLRIEMVTNGRSSWMEEKLPAAASGLGVLNPVIRFIDSLSREERIEAIAYELVHILLFYRFGLGMFGRRTPHSMDSDEVSRYFSNMHKNWGYLLGQTGNTTHHLILIDYLKEKYDIESNLHLRLLQHNFRVVANGNSMDKESWYPKGLVAFEYEKLIGKVDRETNFNHQSEFFGKAYSSAQKHFGGYHFHAIPSPSTYEENVFSFLEDLGYSRGNFMFFPKAIKPNREKVDLSGEGL